MELQTSRLLLQELTRRDLEAIHQLHSIPEVDRYNTLGLPGSMETTRLLLDEWLAQQTAEPRMAYTFAIKLKDSGIFIGMIAIRLDRPKYRKGEVWYKILPGHWGLGYTTEALKELLGFGFSTLHLHRIEAGCAVENIASVRVLEKAGMSREGLCRQILPIRGNWVDNYFYAILDTDVR